MSDTNVISLKLKRIVRAHVNFIALKVREKKKNILKIHIFENQNMKKSQFEALCHNICVTVRETNTEYK